MNSKEKLMKIKNEGFFTASLSFEEFISGLCTRYTRAHGRLLPHDDYDYIVQSLEETGEL